MTTAGPRARLVAAVRILAICLAATLVVLLVVMWWGSLRPGAYSLTEHAAGHGGASGGVSVADLTADADRAADVKVELTARHETVQLASGASFEGYTLNGATPGPTIRATQGQLVEVLLRNEDVAGGVTLHWHGVDVPAAMDGVAGVTQDAVGPGESFVYRFVAEQAGTFWYHSHQISHEQVIGGLFGMLVLAPAEETAVTDVVAAVHTYPNGIRTVSGEPGVMHVPAQPGDRVRVRVANTDNVPLSVWSGAPFVLRAVDGGELSQPPPIEGKRVTLTAGARVDVEVEIPASGGVSVQLPGASIVLGADPGPAPQPTEILDLLSYGEPTDLPFDPEQPDRSYRYDIGRMPGFIDGKPGFWWTVNGKIGDDIPMFMVKEGDVVRMTITNGSGEVHPMHLHGHHMLVLSRNGEQATGSSWWVDSLNVEHGDTYEVVFVADNPGVWMDHCHNLPHAAEGLIAHVMYEGVTTPFMLGHDTGNNPE
ncbi:multicopper oxidase family protein [Microbacterium sp. H1-D42]|uniref:multicopper oxidase family protein n=1 Tax=Microbacterium sp. H1-D42 TaxID=2925844 RepID=UPI001F53ADC9|nr:multicopper oxidase family protein [Microbacterium sp. H1-D42]UNK69572.1 multicopper oxidase family protein [Microbacterium sp. H1-D42]